MQYDDQPKLFLWRGEQFLSSSQAISLPVNNCPFCSAPLIGYPGFWGFQGELEKISMCECNLCGWGVKHYRQFQHGYPEYVTKARFLKAFSINSSNVALNELGVHLKKNFSDIYYLNPYRFEELVGDIFKNIGYEIELTKKSKDGGVDLFILKGSSEKIGIVQCKRYRKEKKVGIEVVDRLIGTALCFDTKQAYIVTTSMYTRCAKERAFSENIVKYGFHVELLDAYDILNFLKVYNAKLPPLNKISRDLLSERGLII